MTGSQTTEPPPTGPPGPPVQWRPRADWRTATALGRFATWAAARAGRQVGGNGGASGLDGSSGFDDLLAWSVGDLGGFWSAVAEFMGVRWHAPPRQPLGRVAMPGTEWFPGGTLSYSEHALRAAGERGGELAVVSVSQSREPLCWTWADLCREVAQVRAWLQAQGIGRGDRVAAYLPNVAEAVAGLLATASLGAVWVSCAPEFGVRSVVDRLGQVQPAVLLAVGGYRYGAKLVDRRRELDAIRRSLPSLRATALLEYGGVDEVDGTTSWDELRALGPVAIEHEAMPFDHPLYVLFSSGTTGLPKALVHTTGGIVLEHWKALALHHDLGPGDRFMWFTTTGWMMWNYLVSGLLTGAAIVCFDGDPRSPDLGTLWRVAAEHRVTVLGVSAPFLLACRRAGLHP
ncbi:MAG TPA: AMP-binding protein, partial [Acidimicrobiales bacterium]|nr:AMP-binding protein [Acidimicrobiales bacterium]